MNKPEAFPIFLRRERLNRNWSQSDLAREISCDVKSIARWENGLTRPTALFIQRLSILFKKSVQELGLLDVLSDDERAIFVEKPLNREEGEYESFSTRLKKLRVGHGWSQSDLAERLECDPRTVSRWEKGIGQPRPDMVQRLNELFDTIPAGLGWATEPDSTPGQSIYYEEMEETPSTVGFCGRAEEIDLLTGWITEDHCRVVGILGLGGMGKTTLAAAVVKEVDADFSRVFWRSLKNAPPLVDILKACLQFLLPQEKLDLSVSIDEQISDLVGCLRRQRCLLVLDNIETIFQPGERAGRYLPKYENYAELFRRLGEVDHDSCLLLTSREKPTELAALEGESASVRLFGLKGLPSKDGQEMLSSRALRGTETEWAELVERYSGNPLALKLAASAIHDVFSDRIADFLQEEEFAFDTINDLLDQHFLRLMSEERELLTWLAIEREGLTREQLRKDQVAQPERGSAFLNAFGSLSRRSLIETTTIDGEPRFSLQPVILEYVTVRLVTRAAEEFRSFTEATSGAADVPVSWRRFAFLKALATDYIREAQQRQILAPLAEQVLLHFRKATLREQLAHLLDQQRLNDRPHNYLAGNVLNVLIYLKLDPRGLDCSGLTIRQAYLQNAALPDTNFAEAVFEETVFTHIFGDILTVTFHPQEDILAAGTSTGDIWLYQVTNGVPLRAFRAHTDAVWRLSFHPDGRLLASSSDDGTVRLWEVESGRLRQTYQEHEGRVRAVAFSPDGRTLASGGNDRCIRLWEVESGRLLRTLEGHVGWVWSVAFHPTAPLLASGGADRMVCLWDLTEGVPDPRLALLPGHEDRVRSVAFHPSGRLLASASDDTTVRLWDLEARFCQQVLKGHTDHVWSVAFDRSGELLASGSEDCTVRFWETSTALCRKTLKEHTLGVRSVAFHSSGLLASGSDDQTIRLWESATGSSLRTFQGYVNRIRSLILAPHPGVLVSANDDQTIRLWSLQTGECSKILRTSGQRVLGLAANPQEPLLASVGSDHLVRLWNLSTGQFLCSLKGHTDWVRGVAFSADGKWLISGGEDNTILLWDLGTGANQSARSFQGHTNTIRALAFSPDKEKHVFASGSDDGHIRLWDTDSGTCIQVFAEHTQPVRALVFHPFRPLLYSASEDQTIKIWDTDTGACLRTLSGHTSHVLGLALDPRVDLDPLNSVLVSCGDDLTIRLWDLNRLDAPPRVIEQAHRKRIRAVVYDSTGRLLASSSDDGKIKFWETSTLTSRQELINDRPYEHMNITGARDLTDVQREALIVLGAAEE